MGNLDLARNLAISEDVSNICCLICSQFYITYYVIHTHTHTRLTALLCHTQNTKSMTTTKPI